MLLCRGYKCREMSWIYGQMLIGATRFEHYCGMTWIYEMLSSNPKAIDCLSNMNLWDCSYKSNILTTSFTYLTLYYTHIYFFFSFSRKTHSISYKILQMRLLCTNPCRDAIVPSYVDAHWLKKGRGRLYLTLY